MDGIVLTKAFNQFLIGAQGRAFRCQMPKTLRRAYNPWPGDYVVFDETALQITAVTPPVHVLTRPRISNLDQLFIVMSLDEPAYSWALVYRYLAYANHHGVAPVLVISKIDMKKDRFPDDFQRQLAKLDVPTIYFSKHDRSGVMEIAQRLDGRISAFAGQTGVGKSSIINELSPDFRQTIGSYSAALGRGRHETKAVVLFPYRGGYIADTPGFSSLELEFGQDELARVFPTIGIHATKCKFPNCLHQRESGCAVTKHVKDGKIAVETYEAYLALLATLPFRKDDF